MECYKITNFNGSIVFEKGNDLEYLLQAVSIRSFIYPALHNLDDVPMWFVVWDNRKPIDKFFYGDEEPEQDVLPEIDRAIVNYRDSQDGEQ